MGTGPPRDKYLEDRTVFSSPNLYTLWLITLLAHIIHTTRLKLFDHIACADSSMDDSSALQVCMGLDQLIRLTTPHLVPDHWIRFGTTQHWSGNCLIIECRTDKREHARRNGNVHRRTSRTMMMMMMLKAFQAETEVSASLSEVRLRHEVAETCCKSKAF